MRLCRIAGNSSLAGVNRLQGIMRPIGTFHFLAVIPRIPRPCDRFAKSYVKVKSTGKAREIKRILSKVQ